MPPSWQHHLSPATLWIGGEAGLRCGEIMALEWTDIDFAKRQLTVARSEWKGHDDAEGRAHSVRADDEVIDRVAVEK